MTKIRLLHISDTHFGRHDDKKRGRVIDFAQNWKPDIVAVTGDLVDSPLHLPLRSSNFSKARQFLDAFRQDVKPTPHILCIPGNHDGLFGRLLMRRSWKDIDYYSGGNTSFVRTYKVRENDVCIIGVDSTHLSLRSLNNTGFFDRRREAVLSNHIEDLRTKPGYDHSRSIKIILVHHHPIPTIGSAAEHMLYFKNAGRFLNFAVRNGVRLILHGHQHDPHFAQVGFGSDHNDDLIAILSAGTCIKRDQSSPPNHFYTIEIDESESLVTSYHYEDTSEDFIAVDDFSISRAVNKSPIMLTSEQHFRLLPNGDLGAQEGRLYKRAVSGTCDVGFSIGVDDDSDECPDYKNLQLEAEVDGTPVNSDDLRLLRDEVRTKRITVNIPAGRRGTEFSVGLNYVWKGGFRRFVRLGNDRGEFGIGSKGVRWCKVTLSVEGQSQVLKNLKAFYKDRSKIVYVDCGFVVNDPQRGNRIHWTAELDVAPPVGQPNVQVKRAD